MVDVSHPEGMYRLVENAAPKDFFASRRDAAFILGRWNYANGCAEVTSLRDAVIFWGLTFQAWHPFGMPCLWVACEGYPSKIAKGLKRF
jgi:hypothetical protein